MALQVMFGGTDTAFWNGTPSRPPERRQVQADIAGSHALSDNGHCEGIDYHQCTSLTGGSSYFSADRC